MAAADGAIRIHGVRVPRLLYGTAWKEDRTSSLTRLALDAGFRGIDTANQRRHYHEAGVGEAVHAWLRDGRGQRDEIFLQTKFTYASGQDHRLPYDPKARPAEQVQQSFASSLEHLGVDRLDAFLLHGPAGGLGLVDLDWQTWHAMEDLQRAGRTRLLGVSNVSFAQLTELHAKAQVKPALVQNRTFTRPAADLEVRAFCAENGIGYEGFSLLTAYRGVLQHPLVVQVAQGAQLTPAQVVLRYCLEQGMIVLTGTTSSQHMAEGLALSEVRLGTDRTTALSRILG